ncbi:Cut8-domain-containing protein, partial [Aureobasidium melanogenum]
MSTTTCGTSGMMAMMPAMDVTTRDARVEEFVEEKRDKDLIDAADLRRHPKSCWKVIDEEKVKAAGLVEMWIGRSNCKNSVCSFDCKFGGVFRTIVVCTVLFESVLSKPLPRLSPKTTSQIRTPRNAIIMAASENEEQKEGQLCPTGYLEAHKTSLAAVSPTSNSDRDIGTLEGVVPPAAGPILQSATGILVVLEKLLVPTSILQVETTASLSAFTDGQSPGLSEFVICFEFSMVVLEGIPCRKAMDDLSNGIEILERECGLRFVWGEEVRSKVLESFDKLQHGLADSVSRLDTRTGSLGGFSFHQEKEFREDEAGQADDQRRRRRVGGRGRHTVVEVVLAGLAFTAGHSVAAEALCRWCYAREMVGEFQGALGMSAHLKSYASAR